MTRANKAAKLLSAPRSRAASESATSDLDDHVNTGSYDLHPLLEGKFFYLLPLELLTTILWRLGKNRFDSELIEMELSLAQSVEDSSSRIGRWQRSWISYEFLGSQKKIQETSVEDGTVSEEDTSEFVRPFTINYLYSTRYHHRIFQSYLGWLLTNLQFLKEHDALFKRNRDAVCRWGVEPKHPSFAQSALGEPSDHPQRDRAVKAFREERDQFYFRWRLSSMIGPYLPVPIGSQPDRDIPISYFIWSHDQTGLYLLPDIVPMPSRDEIRRSIDQSRRRVAAPEHLDKWLRIIRSGNKAKNELDRFARIFKLQHYWRLLQCRHRSALKASVGKLEAVFAHWLHVSEDTIHQDRLKIVQRLGSDWAKRNWSG